MSTKLLAFVVLAIMTATFLPIELFATTTDFGAAGFTQQTTKIQNFLFGPAMRLVGVFGLAYGIMQGIATGSVKPFLVGGGICLTVCVMPVFIDAVFVSGMLLP